MPYSSYWIGTQWVHNRPAQRNYDAVITSSLIKDEFLFVDNVYTILPDGSDFDAIVSSKGSRIVYPTRWTDPISAYDSMKQYGDIHSDVESSLKTICYNEGTTEQFVLSPPKTIPQIFNIYYICWYLSHVSRVITRNRKLRQRKDAIIANSDNFHVHLSVVKLQIPCHGIEYGLSCGDADYLVTGNTKLCLG